MPVDHKQPPNFSMGPLSSVFQSLPLCLRSSICDGPGSCAFGRRRSKLRLSRGEHRLTATGAARSRSRPPNRRRVVRAATLPVRGERTTLGARQGACAGHQRRLECKTLKPLQLPRS